MIKLMQISTVILLTLEPVIQKRYFTSSADLELLLKTEGKVIKSLQSYVKAEKKRLNYLDKYLARLKTEHETAMKDIPYYFGNPINAYTIIKRLGPDLIFAEDIVKIKTELKTPEAIFPTEEDMTGSALSLVNMLSVYNINVSQLTNGIFNSTARAPMTASDCYSIGMTLYYDKQYKNAITWLEEAYKKVEEMHCDLCPISAINVIDLICKMNHEIGDMDNFIEWTEKRIILKPDDPESFAQTRYIDVLRRHKKNVKEKTKKQRKTEGTNIPNVKMANVKKKTKERRKTEGTNIPNVKMANIKEKTNEHGKMLVPTLDICFGISKINKSSHRLSCYYAHGPHPVLTLAPLKAERLHRDPDLTMFYEVLSDADIHTIETLSKPKLWNSTSSEDRCVDFINLDDQASNVVARVSRRALHLSGLSSEDCEPFRIINYGIGGIYHDHFDRNPPKLCETKRNDSDKKGTIMFYLSDVELGGATVFRLLDLAVFPKKGAALFWMNELPSGDKDMWTLHAACPVLSGNKWIALKWPHRYLNRDWCPVWRTEKGIVTEQMYKEILKHREDHYRFVLNGCKYKYV